MKPELTDRWAAFEEQISEAALDAERIYDFLRHAPEEEALGYLRLMLKAKTAVDLAYGELKRVLEQRAESLNSAATASEERS